jgi:hypothetical protein
MPKNYKQTILIVIGITVFVLLHVFNRPFQSVDVFDNFNKLAIGIAALITAYYGTNYFIEEVSRKGKIDYYRKLFPYDEYGKTWEIISREDSKGQPHVLNIKTSEIHHLWNQKTIYDLGWQFFWKDERLVKKSEWEKFKRGDYIRTRGELGE